jgi:MFS family permease
MFDLRRTFRLYRLLSASFYRVFAAHLLLTVIQTAFLLIFNLLLKKYGYSDAQIGTYISMQYLGVLLLSFPLGFVLRGRRIRPYFLASGILTPLLSLAALQAAVFHFEIWLYVLLFFWGMGFVSFQIGVLPWLLRNTTSHLRTEAIAFLYTNFSMSQILAGLVIWGLVAGLGWNEYRVLQVISTLGLLSPVLCWRVREVQPDQARMTRANFGYQLLKGYDWGRIARVMIPNTWLTIGAGLTMPFMNLFFFSIYGLDSDAFSLMSLITAVLVVGSTLYIARIRRQFGYRIAITLSQGVAVLLLFGIAVLALEPHWVLAFPLTVLCFMVRQPLMHAAVPMTRELMLLQAGERNREMISALLGSIKSGTYFFSAQVFALLRGLNLDFAYIFLITATFYGMGVYAYYRLIVSFERERLPAQVS